MSSAEQDAYVRRVLGVDPTVPGVRPASAAGPLLPAWIEARDSAAVQLSALSEALNAFGTPLAREIADKGLGAVTGRLQVGLHVALLEVDRASVDARQALAARALDRVSALRAFVADHRGLARMESNPFGVPFRVRDTIVPALDRIAAALRDGARSG